MPFLRPSHLAAASIVGLALAAGPAACAPGVPETSSTGFGAAGPGGADGGGADGPDLFGDGDSGITDAIDPDAACGKVTKQATSTPLDLYILLDKSSSMVGDKWTGAQGGLGAFVTDPASAGIFVGLKLFPRAPDAVPACDQPAYETPDVPFAALPANAKPITDAMAAAMPDGFNTPIYPALGGAILESIALLQKSPGNRAAVLLVTDGQPSGPAPLCAAVNPEDPTVIANLAATGASQVPPVLTYVIGLPGVNQAFANQVAAAGGTGAAILVGASDVKGEFEAALAKVRGEALPCEYVLPDEVTMGTYDTGHVNVLYTPGAGSPTVLPQDQTCASTGWKYDDPAKPTKILLCPASCSVVKKDGTGKVDVLLGCKTEIAK
jgi:hypothetical protein